MTGQRWQRLRHYVEAQAKRADATKQEGRAFILRSVLKRMEKLENHCDHCGRAPDKDGKFSGRLSCHCEDDS